MELDGEAIRVMAECISRNEHLTVETLPVTECGLKCDTCGVLAVAVWPLRGISSSAVYDLGTVSVCTSCSVPLCVCGHNVPDHEHGPCEECDCGEFRDE